MHGPVSESWHGIPFSNLRATDHQTALHFDVREAIPGCHEPPACGVVPVRDDAVIVHGHDYLDASLRFEPVKYDAKAWAQAVS